MVADDPADPSFPAAEPYIVDASVTLPGATPSATGSETYQIHDGDTGRILDIQPVSADGTVTLTFAAGPNRHAIHADDGSLAIALPAVVDSRYAGVDYLAPDDDQTQATVFLAEGLSRADAPPAA